MRFDVGFLVLERLAHTLVGGLHVSGTFGAPNELLELGLRLAADTQAEDAVHAAGAGSVTRA